MKILADDNIVAYIFRTYERGAKIAKIGKDDEYAKFLRDFSYDVEVVGFDDFLRDGVSRDVDGVISVFDFSDAKFSIDELGGALKAVANRLKNAAKFFICVKSGDDTAVRDGKVVSFERDDLIKLAQTIGKTQIEHVRLTFDGRSVINDYYIMITECEKDIK